MVIIFVGHIYELPIFTPMRSLTDTLSRCKNPASNITNPPNSFQNLAPTITNHRNYLSIFPRKKQLIQGGQNRCVFPAVVHHQLGRSPLVLLQLGPVACEPGDWEEMWCYYMTTWYDMIWYNVIWYDVIWYDVIWGEMMCETMWDDVMSWWCDVITMWCDVMGWDAKWRRDAVCEMMQSEMNHTFQFDVTAMWYDASMIWYQYNMLWDDIRWDEMKWYHRMWYDRIIWFDVTWSDVILYQKCRVYEEYHMCKYKRIYHTYYVYLNSWYDRAEGSIYMCSSSWSKSHDRSSISVHLLGDPRFARNDKKFFMEENMVFYH